jgi:repressor LexA
MVHPSTARSPAREAPLTARQREILAYIQREARRGRPPTRADIAERFGIARPTAQQHVVALERRGALRRVPGSRGLMPVRDANAVAVHAIPVVGRVAAGLPVLAVEDASDALALPDGLFCSRPDVLLRVQGDSMIGAGMLDGDLVAVLRRSDAQSGEIVVARLDDEITVKRLRRRGATLELVAENPAYAPIAVTGERDFAIEGVVLGVIRRY